MTPTEKKEQLIARYHNLIQDLGGDLGQEILVSVLAEKCTKIAVDEILNILFDHGTDETYGYWSEILEELLNLKNKNNV
jgi:hypothetical protein